MGAGGGGTGSGRIERRGGEGAETVLAARALGRGRGRDGVVGAGHGWVGPDEDALELCLAPEGAKFMQLEEIRVRVCGRVGGG